MTDFERTYKLLRILVPILRYGGSLLSVAVVIFISSGLLWGILIFVNVWILAAICEAVAELYRQWDDRPNS